MKNFLILTLMFCLTPLVAQAGNVGITKDLMSITVKTNKGPVKIMRNQDNKAVINPGFAKTSRKCPPFCVQPQSVADGVKTVGELEVVKYMEKGNYLPLLD